MHQDSNNPLPLYKTMLKILLLCLSLVCLTNGVFIRDGCDSYMAAYYSSWPLSIWNINYGNYLVTDRVTAIQEEAGLLVPKLLTNSTDKDWQDIMAGLTQFMEYGLSIYQDILYETINAGGRMFEGDHEFKKFERCEALENQDFSYSGYFSEFAAALGKDLPCFGTLLSETYALKLNSYKAECMSTEDEAIEFITDLVRVLFRLRNAGDRFFHSIAKTAELAAGDELHDHFINAFNGTDGIPARKVIRNFDTA